MLKSQKKVQRLEKEVERTMNFLLYARFAFGALKIQLIQLLEVREKKEKKTGENFFHGVAFKSLMSWGRVWSQICGSITLGSSEVRDGVLWSTASADKFLMFRQQRVVVRNCPATSWDDVCCAGEKGELRLGGGGGDWGRQATSTEGGTRHDESNGATRKQPWKCPIRQRASDGWAARTTLPPCQRLKAILAKWQKQMTDTSDWVTLLWTPTRFSSQCPHLKKFPEEPTEEWESWQRGWMDDGRMDICWDLKIAGSILWFGEWMNVRWISGWIDGSWR